MGKIDHSPAPAVPSLTGIRLGCCALALGAVLAACTARPAGTPHGLPTTPVPDVPLLVPPQPAANSCDAAGVTMADYSTAPTAYNSATHRPRSTWHAWSMR